MEHCRLARTSSFLILPGLQFMAAATMVWRSCAGHRRTAGLWLVFSRKGGGLVAGAQAAQRRRPPPVSLGPRGDSGDS
ncbi:hypothetical protein BDA96_09G191400 [Sorghum bicolor]|uniref:Secreted protein n=2 Tax=Sorghum bicolor TaxID=4558 RepID=A0A921QBD6_SORBI|nr:hypothetical protein BDA96_09G191400 [Sorghum bicolor]KXG22250.1 hypothetical protein SORBI_3009G181000 [Sorghum bicolor]